MIPGLFIRCLAMTLYRIRRMKKGTRKNSEMLPMKKKTRQNVSTVVRHTETIEPSMYSSCSKVAIESIGLKRWEGRGTARLNARVEILGNQTRAKGIYRTYVSFMYRMRWGRNTNTQSGVSSTGIHDVIHGAIRRKTVVAVVLCLYYLRRSLGYGG